MSVKSIKRRNNLGSANTDDAYSDGVWADCPIEAIRDGLVPAHVFEYDFPSIPTTPPTAEGAFGQFTAFTDTGGTIAPVTDGRGWALGSDGDNEGASIRSKVCPFKIIRTGKKMWFEAAIKSSTITDTKHGFFLGLIEETAFSATVPIAAAGTLADKNFVGFHRLEGDGDMLDTVYKADGVTQVTVGADAVTLVADTWVKVGFVFDPASDNFVHDPARNGVKYLLKFFKNGVPLADRKQIPSAAGTDFPNDVYMGPAFAVLNATAATPGTSAIRRLRCVQLI